MSVSLLEQLYYTHSVIGLRGGIGWQIRAISPGLRQRLSDKATIIQQLGYRLPSDMDPSVTQPETAPCCLALLDMDGERWLIHKAFVRQGADGRPGIHFTHIVALRQARLTAREAIRMWASPFWKTSDADLPATTELANITLDQLEPGPLDRTHLRAAVSRDDLTWLIQAFLTRPPGQRLYLAGESHVIANLIYGLTLCLPTQLLHLLTFTTYEPELLRGVADIVGTTLNSGEDLPSVCYEGDAGFGLNCGLTGRRSALPASPVAAKFAQQAVERLIDGVGLDLDKMVALAELKQVATTDRYLALFRFFSREALDRRDIDLLLEDPNLAATILTRTDIQATVLNLTVADDNWWSTSGEMKLRAMRRSPPPSELDAALHALANTAFERAQSLLASDQPQPAARLLDGLAAVANGSDANPYWPKLLSLLPPPGSRSPSTAYSLQVRHLLLRRWANLPSLPSLTEIHPWLRTSWDEVDGYLSLGLPDDWQHNLLKQVVLASPDPSPYPANFADLTRTYGAIIDAIIIECVRDRYTRDTASRFFATLVNTDYPGKLRLLSSLLAETVQEGDFQSVLGQIAVPRGALTERDASGLLSDMRLAEVLLPRADVQEAILNYALTNMRWWLTASSDVDRLRIVTRQERTGRVKQALLALRGLALDQAESALRQADVPRAIQCIDDVIRVVSDNSLEAWLDLLPRLTPPGGRLPRAAYTGAAREQLLKRWAAAQAGDRPSVEQVKPWLVVTWAELPVFLPHIPIDKWQEEMVLNALRGEAGQRPRGDTFRDLVTRWAALFHSALALLAKQPADRPEVLNCFQDLVSAYYQGYLNLLEVILAAAPDDLTFKANLVQAATPPNGLSEDQYTVLLTRPVLAAAFFANAPVCTGLVELFSNKAKPREIWTAHLASLREQADKRLDIELQAGLDNLTQAAWQAAQAAIRKSDTTGVVERAIALVEKLARAAQPSTETTWSLWESVLEPLKFGVGQASNRSYPLPTRLALIVHWGTLPKHERPPSADIKSWLQLTWKEMGLFLALELPSDWYRVAVQQAILLLPKTVQEMADLTQAHHEKFNNALRDLVLQGKRDPALTFLRSLAELGYERRSGLAGSMLYAGPDTGDWSDRVLRVAQLDEESSVSFLFQHGSRLLKQHPIAPTLIPVIDAYLDRLTVPDCQRLEVRQFLALLRETRRHGVSQKTLSDIETWQTIANFFAAPQLKVEPLQRLAQAMGNLPESKRDEAIAALFLVLSRTITSAAHVDMALRALQPLVSANTNQNDAARARKQAAPRSPAPDAAAVQKRLMNTAWQVYTQLGDASGIPPHVEYITDPQYHVPDWQRELSVLLQNADQTILNTIAVAEEKWNADTRTRWNTYRRTYRPTASEWLSQKFHLPWRRPGDRTGAKDTPD